MPQIVGAAGTSSSEKVGWRLDLEIRHDGNRLDGLKVAEDAVAHHGRAHARDDAQHDDDHDQFDQGKADLTQGREAGAGADAGAVHRFQ